MPLRFAAVLLLLFASVCAFGQGAVLGAISFPTTDLKEWHFALMSGEALKFAPAGFNYWNYKHKTFSLRADHLWLCTPGCSYKGTLVGKVTKTSTPDPFCVVENAAFSGSFTDPNGVVTPNALAIYSQTFCTRAGFSLGGGDLTVELP